MTGLDSSTLSGKATKVAAAFIVGLIALNRTAPNAIQHFQELYHCPLPIELLKDATEVPESKMLGYVMEKSPFDWHNYLLFSTTTNRATGARGSIGILGSVIDTRNQEQRDEEWWEAGRESRERMFKGMEASLERTAKLLEMGDEFKQDYSSRGCAIEDVGP